MLRLPIPYGRQTITDADIAAVEAVLRSDYLTQGPAVSGFEQAIAAYCGARYATAVCNATAALHIACRALGLGPGDRLWTVPNTFVASANCGLYCGAAVDFVDIDPRSYNLSPDALEQKLKQAEIRGELPKVIVAVDFGGQSAPMREIAALSHKYGFRVIEDASHAVGGDYLAKKIGASVYADITVFSFHPVKIITTGEGGVALTNDPGWHERLQILRTHGITRDRHLMDNGDEEGAWYYEQVDLGYNYRITDLQAALGQSQLTRVDEFVARRRALANRYGLLLNELPLTTPWQSGDGESAWHLYVIRLRDAAKRASVFSELRSQGVLANVHYIPVHLQPYFRRMGFKPGDFPEAETYYQAALSLPLYFDLTEEQQDYVVDILSKALQ